MLGALISPLAQAQTTNAETTETTSWWKSHKDHAVNILDKGELNLMVSGYAHHGRNTYTPERIAELNEKAWGLGFMETVRDVKDNEESLFGLAISDSHFRPQLQAGYTYQWMHDVAGPIEAGVGWSAMLMSRTDYFAGFPFPVALPVASIGTKKNKLMAVYVPRLSKNKGNGDVLLIFARFDIN